MSDSEDERQEDGWQENGWFEKADQLAQQAYELSQQYQVTQVIEDLDSAISMFQRVVELVPEDDPRALIAHNLLGLCLQTRYNRLQEFDDLERMISVHERVLRLTADDDPEMPERLARLASFLFSRFIHSGELGDLERATSTQRLVLAITPEDHFDMPKRLNMLGVCLSSRFERTQKLDDLDEAISTQRRAVEITPGGHEDMLSRLILLKGAFLNRFEHLNEPSDLDHAIATQQKAMRLMPDSNPDKPKQLNNLADLFMTRFERFGELDDLESVILTQRRAIQLVPEGNLDARIHLNSLGNGLIRSFDRLEDLVDLDNAISTQRRALDLTPKDQQDMPARLGSLERYLSSRFNRLGELDHLEGVIIVQRRVLELIPEGHPDMPIQHGILGMLLLRRYERLGVLGDLEEAISMMRHALNLTPEGHPDVPGLLNHLGVFLNSRFNHLGDLEDIDTAISTHRRAIKLTPEGHFDIPKKLDNLANSLLARFYRLRDINDLESAISAQRHALELTPEDHTSMPGRLSSLGGCLSVRFDNVKELDDLESAISMQRRALQLTSEDHADMPSHLYNLGGLLSRRFGCLKEHDDLENAISLNRRALELTPEGHTDMPSSLNSLAVSLRARFESLGEVGDLDSAISIHRRVLELVPQDHARLPLYLATLGFALWHQFELHRNQNNFNAIIKNLKTASFLTQDAPFGRLLCANMWAVMESCYPEFGSPASLLQAHSRIIDNLPEVIWLGYSITRRYQESAKVAQYVNSSVSETIELGNLAQAVEWLDMGKGLIWSQVLSLRTPVSELAQHHPDLASELQQLSVRLQHDHLVQLPEATFTPSSTFSIDSLFSHETNHHQTAAIAYEGCLKKIRACPGFERFLRPEKLTDLVSLTAHLDGCVVFINVSASRCDALVITRGGTIMLVPLSKLTQKRANTLRNVCTHYLRANKVRQRAIMARNTRDGRGFFRLLDRIWKLIVRPVLEALDLMAPEPGRLPHITWCPTGPLTQLPLHAAGLHPESGPSGPHIYDFVVSSYTPSLSALVRAQNAAAQPTNIPSVLVVTQSNTPDLPSLPGTDEEGSRLQKILSEAQIRSELLSNDRATVEAVEGVIGQSPWAHFACHGVQDTSDPTQSAFALHDGKLTLSTLMRTVAEGAELAFLSACQTATGDESVPEESAHLTAGMLAVGFKGVIGTMWSIGDADAPVVVEAYYKKLLELRNSGVVAQGSTGAAYALHEAVKVLRETVGETSFLRWVPFVHYGV